MNSSSSTDKSLTAIAHRLKGELGKDLSAEALHEILNKALDCLTKNEREFVAMKTTIGLPDSKIMGRFGFSDQRALSKAASDVFSMLRLYCNYFAKIDHARAMLTIKLDLGGDLDHWLRVFKGERQVFNALRYPVDTIEDPHAKAFVQTTIEISKYRRL